MSAKPGWRWAFDTLDRNVSPRVEALVHSDEFAPMTAVVAWRRGRSELWRYRSGHTRVSPPLL